MRFVLNTGINNIDYADGLPHDVIVRRSDDGRNLTIEITTEGADANRTKVYYALQKSFDVLCCLKHILWVQIRKK